MEHKRYQRILATLSVFAMLFCNLNVSSFAEENTGTEENRIRTICGLEEHTHTDECYEKTLVCGKTESGKKTEKRFSAFRVHEHNDGCYDEAGNLNCGIIAGKYYHAHNEYCYDKAGNLVCGLEEVWPHEHTDACYETEKKLVCGKEEAEGHKHTDACYKQNRELICEKAEDPGHHHSDACYTEHTTLTCGKQEDPGHHHGDACYTEQTNLTCGKQEDPGHHHSDACYTEHTTLTCEKQEDLGHHHSDACYTEHTTLTCGKQEDPGHHHSDECYRDQQVLTCEQDGNEDHTHTEECYTTLRELICEEPERDGHTHGESCYTTTRDLTCGETERDGHTHGDACYTTLRELTCGEKERDGHTHNDACYTTTRELTCQEPERDGHAHSDACYTTTRDLTCQEKERDGHTHTDDCYRVWNELVCEKEEKEGHIHSESCYETQQNLICKELSTTHHHTATCRGEEGRLICGEIEVQEFVSTADRWTETVISEGHHHTDACYEQTLICEKEEHAHTDVCYPAPEENEDPDEDPAEDSTEEPVEATGEETGNDSEDETGEEADGETGEDSEDNEDGEEADSEDETGEEDGGENEKDTEDKKDGEEADSEDETGEDSEDNEAGEEADSEDETGEDSEDNEAGEEDDSEDETGEEDGEENEEDAEDKEDGETDEDEDGEETGGENEEDTETEQNGETDGEDETGEDAGGENEEDTETGEDGKTDSEDETGDVTGGEGEEDTETEEDGETEGEDEAGEETDEEELTEEPNEVTLSAEDTPVAVSISFLSNAGIPEGTKLVVSEAGEEMPAGEKSQMRLAKAAPMKSAGLRGAATPQERHVDIPSMAVWNAGETAPDIILYQKTLDISLVSEGEEIEPDSQALITVTVQLPGIEDGQEVEVRHITDGGTELLESTNDAGNITFTTNGFSLFEFTSRAQALSAWSTGQTASTFYGKTTNQEAYASAISVGNVTEGLEVLEAYSLTQSSDLWMTLQQTSDPALGKLESLVLYTLEDGTLGAIIRDNVSQGEVLRFNLGDLGGYALVRDTGLRHIVTEQDNVTLDGMMPKNSVAEVSDVTDNYSGEDFQTETPESEEDEERNETIQVVAAYDISILNNGEDYQPAAGQPISVEIRDGRIPAEDEIELWHIRDDGSREQVTDFMAESGRIEFNATGFSVYMVIIHEDRTVGNPRVEFHFIHREAILHSDGTNAYYEGTPYLFKNKHNEQQSTQILSNGEALELITDPGNLTDQYFYGWYVVNPFVISEITNEYGIGTGTPRKLYYTWPVLPEYITFESPISIQESNVEIGGTVHWSLNGVSGSGTVDKDGSVHVFLAPVYEKYNFVNFMLYARNVSVSGANSLMTRKLIAMGSAESVEIKISDIRSTSRDAVHLVFTGWEYQDKDTNEWIKIKTVSPTGTEITQPGRDGVYITGVNLAEGDSIDLYPIFVEARWTDFVSGITGSGASFVGSRFLEAWGRATPDGTVEEEGKNIITSLETSVRKGYAFEGWYAFAVTDPATGEITNLNEKKEVLVNYIDDDYVPHTVTIETKAVKIANDDGTIAFDGEWKLDTGNGEVTLFSAENGKLKFHDPLDRLTLYANWTPQNSGITIVYWTENAENDEYTSSAVRHITTAELNLQLGTNYASGSEITLDGIAAYQDESAGISVLSRDYLDDVGAVPKAVTETVNGQERILKPTDAVFFDLNEDRSDESKVIDGEGNAIFNVYFSRKIFRLVFHIGRDNYVKSGGNQRTAAGWDGNWIEYMYKDSKVNGPVSSGGLGYPEHTDRVKQSYECVYAMTFGGNEYTSEYVTTSENVMGDYPPSDGENLYIIEAKYGADISSQWPSFSNSAFDFYSKTSGFKYFPYIWSAYYGSLYCRIANERSGTGNDNGKNPDINGVYKYMSAELCANRAGDGIINDNQVHHLVAWFGEANKPTRFKQYHTLYEAIDGTYDPDAVEIVPGTDYVEYEKTTWTQENTAGDKSEIIGHYFYEIPSESPQEVLSNLEPQFQLSSDLEGYQFIYSCYEPNQRDNPNKQGQKDYHIYFFYRPIQYSLTFMYENADERKTDQYYYKESLKDAKKYPDPEKEGYRFRGWFTNEVAGEDEEPFDFENSTMPSRSIVLYPVFEKLEYVIKIDPNGGVIDHWTTNSTSSGASTGFRANYKEKVVAYNFLERNYMKTSDAEIVTLGLNPDYDVYYYLNTQYLGVEHDGNFIPSRLRNALYLTVSGIDEYWAWYSAVPESDFTSRRAIKFTDKNEWMDAYFGGHDLDKLTKYRAKRGVENYSFMGWYQVYADGSVATVPFNFNTLITEDIEIRAMWRLDGGYYIHYDPHYYHVESDGTTEVVTAVIGEVDQWNDPEDPTQKLYADQSPTHILRGPNNVTQGWVFRGWRIVQAVGRKTLPDGHGGTVEFIDWKPIQFDAGGNVIYYQPGDSFTVNSDYVTENSGQGAVIYMQAYYEPEDTSYRRPEIINLILDANTDYGGYVNSSDQNSLPELDHPGRSGINTADYLDGEGRPTQILFGDTQSNLAVHLYRYATTKTFDSIQGINYFSNEEPYFLIGFDEEKDPLHPSTGSAYVPAYSPDSVIAVTRKSNITLYAMWEPKIYVTFVNKTNEDITVRLSGNGTSTVHIVNMVTGEYDREVTTGTVVVPAKTAEGDGMIRVVLPRAAAGSDTFTATALNDHRNKKISSSGTFGEMNPYGNGSEDIPYEYNVTYSGTLQIDQEGIYVTYTEKDDRQIDYDVNGGIWTDTAPYTETGEGLYSLDSEDITDNGYEPSDPTHTDKVFIGWTTNADIAAHTDFTGTHAVTWGDTVIIPEDSENILDVIRRDYLWDFSRPASDAYDMTLYAIWADAITVTFDLIKTGNTLHNWTGPATTDRDGLHVFYRSSPTSRYVTYKLLPGEKVQKPSDPLPYEESTWRFYNWLTNDSYKGKAAGARDIQTIGNSRYIYDFSLPITENKTLYTSWTNQTPQVFTFTVQNNIQNANSNDECTYTVTVKNEEVDKGKISQAQAWGSVTTKLKNNSSFTVRITVLPLQPYQSGWAECYGVTIDVIDSDGNIIKSRQALRNDNLTYKYYASQYTYTVSIDQTESEGFVSVGVDDNVSGIACSTSNENRSYTFIVKQGSKFTPNQNVFNSGETKSLKVVFNNERDHVILPAPTGFISRHTPYYLLLLIGFLLLIILGGTKLIQRGKTTEQNDPSGSVNTVRFRTKRTERKARGTGNGFYQNSIWGWEGFAQAREKPPCPQIERWTQPKGSPGMRGDPGR